MRKISVFFCVLGTLLIIGFCIYLLTNNSPLTQHDTFYFIVVDEKGNESVIHDSGVKPSEISNSFSLQVLKKEYNDGKENCLEKPVMIRMGRNPQDLRWNIDITSEDVIEEELYYIVHVVNPLF